MAGPLLRYNRRAHQDGTGQPGGIQNDQRLVRLHGHRAVLKHGRGRWFRTDKNIIGIAAGQVWQPALPGPRRPAAMLQVTPGRLAPSRQYTRFHL